VIKDCAVDFTSDEAKLKEVKFHIVSVPTPVSNDNTPDLAYVISAYVNLKPGQKTPRW